MQRRWLGAAAAVVVAAGAAVVVALPSTAGTVDGAESAVDGTVSPEVFAAMRRDLGLDEEQATARFERGAWAGRVAAELETETGDRFGGSWLAQDGTTLKVAVTRRSEAAKVTAAGAEPVLVTRSERDLNAAKSRLDRAAGAGTRDLAGWYADPGTNRVVVQALPGRERAAWALARRAGLDTGAVTVTTQAQWALRADVRGADPYNINGNARCSVGFAVQGGFVTAGHCGRAGSTTADVNGGTPGRFQRSVFPGSADMAFVAVAENANTRLLPVVSANNQLVPVRGSTEAPVGAAVCRSGQTTGTRCGRITQKNVTITLAGTNQQVTGLTATNVCAEQGDSGGPFLAGDQAQGMTSAGVGDCRGGFASTVFQPIGEILADQRLTLLTSAAAGGGGGAPAGQAVACNRLPERHSGDLNQGTARTHAAFDARAGRQTVCLQGPAGTDFDLVVQRRGAGGQFTTVFRTTSANATKAVLFDGRGGTYRFQVAASAGSGSYRVRASRP